MKFDLKSASGKRAIVVAAIVLIVSGAAVLHLTKESAVDRSTSTDGSFWQEARKVAQGGESAVRVAATAVPSRPESVGQNESESSSLPQASTEVERSRLHAQIQNDRAMLMQLRMQREMLQSRINSINQAQGDRKTPAELKMKLEMEIPAIRERANKLTAEIQSVETRLRSGEAALR